MQVHANMAETDANMAETDANPQDAFRDKAKIESEVATLMVSSEDKLREIIEDKANAIFWRKLRNRRKLKMKKQSGWIRSAGKTTVHYLKK